MGDVFSFCSGLYFRGKLAYARHFAQPPAEIAGVQIITPSRGLVSAEFVLGVGELAEFAAVPIDAAEARYAIPLKRTANQLADDAGACEVVLLGSVATGKYLGLLLPIFGVRLLFPEEFAGRGDMSRGALLLRAVAAQTELLYRRVPFPPASTKRQAR